MKNQTFEIGIVNGQVILVIENGEKMVPVRPICDALGIAFQSQKEKIEDDEILSSTVTLSMTVAADGKEREMFCIPLKYVFGWLFTINPKNVKEEAKEFVKAYRKECYDVLFRYFTDHAEFYKQKQKAILEQNEKLALVRKNFREAREERRKAEETMHKLAEQTYEQWVENNRQLKLFGE
jgi:hypothetical protein